MAAPAHRSAALISDIQRRLARLAPRASTSLQSLSNLASDLSRSCQRRQPHNAASCCLLFLEAHFRLRNENARLLFLGKRAARESPILPCSGQVSLYFRCATVGHLGLLHFALQRLLHVGFAFRFSFFGLVVLVAPAVCCGTPATRKKGSSEQPPAKESSFAWGRIKPAGLVGWLGFAPSRDRAFHSWNNTS